MVAALSNKSRSITWSNQQSHTLCVTFFFSKVLLSNIFWLLFNCCSTSPWPLNTMSQLDKSNHPYTPPLSQNIPPGFTSLPGLGKNQYWVPDFMVPSTQLAWEVQQTCSLLTADAGPWGVIKVICHGSSATLHWLTNISAISHLVSHQVIHQREQHVPIYIWLCTSFTEYKKHKIFPRGQLLIWIIALIVGSTLGRSEACTFLGEERASKLC